MRHLNIIQLCADRGIAPGSTKGAAQHLRGIAAGLSQAGHTVTTFSQRRAEGRFPVRVFALHKLTPDRASSADVIYERYSLGHRGGLELARAVGANFVLEVNAPLVDEALAHRPDTVASEDRETEMELLGQADLVITVSTELTRWAQRFRTGPTMTIPNGFEPSWFPIRRREWDRPVLGFIGHPKPWHGADRLPQLLADLAVRNHRPQLLIIGGGAGASQIMTRAEELGVAGQITVTGALPADQASSCLGDVTIGLAPYPAQDPFYFCPLKIVDYLASGLPIVSTRQGDITSMVGDAGVVVDPSDDQALVAAVVQLLDNPELAMRMGSNGRQRAMDTMTWDRVAADTALGMFSLDQRVRRPV